MHFYRSLGPIGALTFDLDDTLYDNGPVITRTEQESLRFVRDYHPSLRELQTLDFKQLRQQLRLEEPDIYHDVSEWRRRAIERAMRNAGLSAQAARQGADATMAHFAQWRSRIDISQETHDTLARLAQKWPLAAVTNGNADPRLFGLSDYFSVVLRSGPDGRPKPYRDLYARVSQALKVPAVQILHVGDDLMTDIAGAVRFGMQACWIMSREDNLMQARKARLLPHIAISRLASLTALI